MTRGLNEMLARGQQKRKEIDEAQDTSRQGKVARRRKEGSMKRADRKALVWLIRSILQFFGR